MRTSVLSPRSTWSCAVTPSVVSQVDSYEEDLDVEGLEGGPFHAVFIRAPWVESVGEGVEVIARAGNSTDGPIVGVRRGNVMATSFHPEVGGDDRIHAMFVDMVACA